ncbi:MAG: pseudouridine synthase [Candidatus Saccharibacteria bacterium]
MEQSPNLLRLNKHLALSMGISRREADNLIDKGSVRINDQAATLGARFSDGDIITVNGHKIAAKTEYQYLVMNKPVGYVCSRRQQGEHPTIYELLPPEFYNLKTVGRLDRDSSGIIILSNDGDFTYQMTHPSFNKTKVYNVRLENDLAPLHQQMISDHGITLEDGVSKLQLERMNDTDRKSWVVTMHEGRNRQIRRTFGSLGYTVDKLHRTNFGNYTLGDLKPGKFQVSGRL